MKNQMPSLSKRVAMAGYGLTTALVAVPALVVSAGADTLTTATAATAACISIPAALHSAYLGYYALDDTEFKLSRNMTTGALAAAALSFGLSAYSDITQDNELENLLNNAPTTRVAFAEHASPSQAGPQEGPRVPFEDNTYVFESGALSGLAFTK